MLFKGWSRKGKQPERQLRRIDASGLSFDINDPSPAERELVQYLSQLTDEDLAEEDDGRVLVRWPAIFRLLDDPYHITSVPLLGLPQPSVLRPALNCKGSLSDASFVLALSWLDTDGRPMHDPVDRNGACITVRGALPSWVPPPTNLPKPSPLSPGDPLDTETGSPMNGTGAASGRLPSMPTPD
jgi:hypothetical protein